MDISLLIVGLFLSYAIIRATLSMFTFGITNNLPPGPKPFPIIGNLHLLGNQPHQSLAKLAKVYGPIMSLKLGQINTVVISSPAATKEILQKQDIAFSSRSIPDALHAQNHYLYSISFMPISSQWRTLRKIMNSGISSGKSLDASGNLRCEKVKELIAYCQKASFSNESVNIGRAAFRTSLNLLSNTVFSKDLMDPYEDSGKEFKELVGNIMIEVGRPNLVDYFPVLRKIDPQGVRRRLDQHFKKILGVFDELINERLGNESKVKHDDVLDVCLKMNQDNPDELSRTQIKMLFLDTFVAGTDTTSSTIEWAMTELLRNPDIMAKAKDEFEKVIGKGNIIKEDEVLKLPYLTCIVKETLRGHPPVPFLLPRKTENELKLNEYTIPKGTQVLVNAWAIGRDPSIWEDSQEFKPERFLSSSIDVRGQDFELIPFGGGRRICPGMPLALRIIPLVLGSLLNNFNWQLDTRIQPNDLDLNERFGITIQKANPLYVVPLPLY
ncbi:7-ethoxycoumarin O-deethylase-like [Bidens hawaiensis]|uniref:7-ethoxycoumarin O-deethylase-like n=1 Tax=Bidens hawaiensis TaxID=980011 RepID=UPI00404AB9A2